MADGAPPQPGLNLIGDPRARTRFKEMLAECARVSPSCREALVLVTGSKRVIAIVVGNNLAMRRWPFRVGITFDRFETRLEGRVAEGAPNWQTVDVADLERLPVESVHPWSSSRSQHLVHLITEVWVASETAGARWERYAVAHEAAVHAENRYRARRQQPPLEETVDDALTDTGLWTFYYQGGGVETWKWRAGRLVKIRYELQQDTP